MHLSQSTDLIEVSDVGGEDLKWDLRKALLPDENGYTPPRNLVRHPQHIKLNAWCNCLQCFNTLPLGSTRFF